MTSLDEAVRALTPEAWSEVEPLLDRFESAWERGEQPRIEDFLPAEAAHRRAALIELVHIDLERRLLQGEPARLEDYVARFPEIGGDASAQPATLSPLTTPRFTGQASAEAPVAAPSIPGYEVLEELGRGGTGVVYKAWEPALKRVVALKMLLAGTLADVEERHRFRREAEAIARLQHPGIVQIHAIGEHAGRPFLALEYLEGGSLQAHLAGNPQEPHASATLLETLARVIHFAHQRGIIHRDLKPANVLLPHRPSADARWAEGIKVTDFGLAKQLNDDTQQTRSGAIVGTPSYMAPEQAEGRIKDIGPATDIYALGAILYELLTGRPPFRSALVLDTLEQVRSQEPVAPSRLQPKVPRDLETICLKCLHKDSHRRYADAGLLADDLRRFLDGRPVQARALSAAGRLLKVVKRRPAVAALLVSIALVAGLGFAGVFWQWQKTQAELERAEGNLYAQRIALADREWLSNHVDRAAQLLAECPPERRGWEWHYLTRLREGAAAPLATGNALGVAYSPDGHYLAVAAIDKESVQVWDLRESCAILRFPHTGPAVAFSSDGKYLASATWQLGPQGEAVADQPVAVIVWEMPSGREVARLSGHAGPVFGLAFHHDGKRLASASLDRTVKVWDLPSGGPLLTYRGHAGWVESVAFQPRGRCLASAGTDGSVRVWDSITGAELAVFTGKADDRKRVLLRMEASKGVLANGDPVAAARPDRLKVWNAATGQSVLPLRGQLHDLHSLAFTPDGQQLAAGFGNLVRVFDITTQQPLLTLRGHTDLVRGLAFDAEGKRLASGSHDQSIILWSMTSGEPLATLRGHSSPVNHVTFRADGAELASSGWDGSVRLWDLTRTGEALTLRGHTEYVRGLAFAPRARLLATAGADRVVRFWDLDRAMEVRALRGHTDAVNAVAFNADGTRVATAGYDHTVRIWDAADGTLLHTRLGHGGRVFGVAFSPDGTEVASAGEDQTVRLWSATSGEARLTLRGHTSRVFGVVFQPDGRRIASASDDGSVRLWDTQRGEVVWVATGHEGDVTNLAFSPDGKRIASSGIDRTVRVWDAATGQERLALRGHASSVTSVAFSADGLRLASAGLDRAVKIWDARTGQELLALRGHSAEVLGVAFSADGVFLAATSVDGTVNVWNAEAVER